MPLETCENCGKEFRQGWSAEEKLLQAIFGNKTLCPKCREETLFPKCAKCHKVTKEGLSFNGKPYHPKCMPYSE